MSTSDSKPVINSGPTATTNTIPDLISQLRSAFQPRGLEKVEQLLISREENMKKNLIAMSTEITNLKTDYDSLEEKHRELAYSNLKIEEEFKNYKREMAVEKLEMVDELKKKERDCEELREQVTRLNEEQKVCLNREKRAKERYSKLLEDFMKVENDKKEMSFRITDSECAKSRSEAEVEGWKKKFGELEGRISRLEEDTGMLMSGDPLFQGNIEEKDMCGNEKYQNETGFGTGNAKVVRPENKESVLNRCEKVHTSTDPHSFHVAYDNRGTIKDRKQSVFESGSSTMMGSSMAGNGKLGFRNLIMLDDSDDEKGPVVDGTTSVSNVSASGIISSAVNWKSFPIGKRASSCNMSECGSDDNTPSGKHKIRRHG